MRRTGALGIAIVLALGAAAAVVLLRDDDGGAAEAVEGVPSVIGLELTAAERRLVDEGYSTQIVRRPDRRPVGTVVAQQPAAGSSQDGGVVVLMVSSGAEGPPGTTTGEAQREVDVPAVTGTHNILAGAAVEQVGLVADSFPVASDEVCGMVLRQEPAAGTKLTAGEHVRLTVSLGPDPLPDAQVPGLSGLAPAARTAAREFGFTVRTVEQPTAPARVGVVLRQTPGALSRAPELSQITLYVGS